MIGIFDSGVGGMTVAKTIEHTCPQYPLIYFGDIAHSPYGCKSPQAITAYCRKNTEFLLTQGATIIIVACNSAAATAGELLRDQYAVPIIDVIAATAQKAAITTNGRIGIIGTRATIQSGVYEKQIKTINPDCQIFSKACPLLVPLIEEGWLKKRETKMILKRYLHPLRSRQIDTLILGCTHYPLLTKLIQQRIGKRVRLIDSSIETALHLKTFLDNSPKITSNIMNKKMCRSPHHPKQNRFFVSDSTPPVQQLADRIFGRKINLIKTNG
ncbi:MAG: glutamate racemase [Candidatus Electrothrix sp. AR4]|nr:glutamate racemase [Candidatus Electrothrix sp. AR4]